MLIATLLWAHNIKAIIAMATECTMKGDPVIGTAVASGLGG